MKDPAGIPKCACVRGLLLLVPALVACILSVASCGSGRARTASSSDAGEPEAPPTAADGAADDSSDDSLIGFGELPPPCIDDAVAPESGAQFFCPVVTGDEVGQTCWSGSQYCSTIVSIGQIRPAIVRTCSDFPCGCGAEPNCKCLEHVASSMGCPYCSDDAGIVVLGCVAP
jgi:hypothetical protein